MQFAIWRLWTVWPRVLRTLLLATSGLPSSLRFGCISAESTLPTALVRAAFQIARSATGSPQNLALSGSTHTIDRAQPATRVATPGSFCVEGAVSSRAVARVRKCPFLVNWPVHVEGNRGSKVAGERRHSPL